MEGQRIEISVPEYKEKERLDTFLVREIARVSRTQIQRLIKEGLITVDGREVKSNHLVQPTEKVEVFIPKRRPAEILPENIPLDIVYEDDFLLVVNKKAGIVVHPAFGHSSGTLVNALVAHSKNLSSMNAPDRPGIVHRIDKDTSGLLVVAKNDYVHRDLAKQFGEKTVKREYLTVVWGRFQRDSGTVETLLARSEKDRRKITVAKKGKNAVTHFEVVESFPLTTLLSLRLETGRTHQIRVHLAHIGHPVFGDQTYGGRGRQLGSLNRAETMLAKELLELMPRQSLHAKMLGFVHPETGESLLFDSDLPDDMKELIDRLREAKREYTP
jgi:23S rRNA pseudouridine1911/1915/1917 synthase